jgi:hypothetical protein
MDSTLNLLKQEINKTQEAEHDLAKWKLGVTAALGVAAFGLANYSKPNFWLLLFIPFVCAYIDLYGYQYQFRILVIAGFLRNRADADVDLREYEKKCEELRGQHIFSLGSWAGLGCSLGASIFGPIFACLYWFHTGGTGRETLLVSFPAAVLIWILGVFLIGFMNWYFQHQVRRISQEDDKPQMAKAA